MGARPGPSLCGFLPGRLRRVPWAFLALLVVGMGSALGHGTSLVPTTSQPTTTAILVQPPVTNSSSRSPSLTAPSPVMRPSPPSPMFLHSPPPISAVAPYPKPYPPATQLQPTTSSPSPMLVHTLPPTPPSPAYPTPGRLYPGLYPPPYPPMYPPIIPPAPPASLNHAPIPATPSPFPHEHLPPAPAPAPPALQVLRPPTPLLSPLFQEQPSPPTQTPMPTAAPGLHTSPTAPSPPPVSSRSSPSPLSSSQTTNLSVTLSLAGVRSEQVLQPNMQLVIKKTLALLMLQSIESYEQVHIISIKDDPAVNRKLLGLLTPARFPASAHPGSRSLSSSQGVVVVAAVSMPTIHAEAASVALQSSYAGGDLSSALAAGGLPTTGVVSMSVQPFAAEPSVSPSAPPGTEERSNLGLIIGVVVGTVALLAGLAAFGASSILRKTVPANTQEDKEKAVSSAVTRAAKRHNWSIARLSMVSRLLQSIKPSTSRRVSTGDGPSPDDDKSDHDQQAQPDRREGRQPAVAATRSGTSGTANALAETERSSGRALSAAATSAGPCARAANTADITLTPTEAFDVENRPSPSGVCPEGNRLSPLGPAAINSMLASSLLPNLAPSTSPDSQMDVQASNLPPSKSLPVSSKTPLDESDDWLVGEFNVDEVAGSSGLLYPHNSQPHRLTRGDRVSAPVRPSGSMPASGLNPALVRAASPRRLPFARSGSGRLGNLTAGPSGLGDHPTPQRLPQATAPTASTVQTFSPMAASAFAASPAGSPFYPAVGGRPLASGTLGPASSSGQNQALNQVQMAPVPELVPASMAGIEEETFVNDKGLAMGGGLRVLVGQLKLKRLRSENSAPPPDTSFPQSVRPEPAQRASLPGTALFPRSSTAVAPTVLPQTSSRSCLQGGTHLAAPHTPTASVAPAGLAWGTSRPAAAAASLKPASILSSPSGAPSHSSPQFNASASSTADLSRLHTSSGVLHARPSPSPRPSPLSPHSYAASGPSTSTATPSRASPAEELRTGSGTGSTGSGVAGLLGMLRARRHGGGTLSKPSSTSKLPSVLAAAVDSRRVTYHGSSQSLALPNTDGNPTAGPHGTYAAVNVGAGYSKSNRDLRTRFSASLATAPATAPISAPPPQATAAAAPSLRHREITTEADESINGK